jgi:pimeloyl-ACP methyl ester carboxylesterase
MRHFLQAICCLGALAVLAFLTPLSWAQAEKVRIKTVDGVDLAGQFYAAKTGKTPPVVMVLHGLKENSRSAEWTGLAKGLSEKGFAVLSFDFRGFGSTGSSEVDPTLFWNPQNTLNLQCIKGPKESISAKEFPKNYYPALINDIAAAKAFLDRRNDANNCNSSNLILIGSEEGATLGAIWLNAEWHRYKAKLNQLGQPMMINAFQAYADTEQPPAGKGVIGAVWLSINPMLGSTKVPLESVLLGPAKKHLVPMAFMYGDEDAKGKATAKNLEKKLVAYKKKKQGGQPVREDKYKYTGTWPEKTSLRGAALLQGGLGTVDKIAEYIDAVAQAKSNEWAEQDFRKMAYVWVTSPVLNPLAPMPGQIIKRPTEMNIIFSDYGKFMR